VATEFDVAARLAEGRQAVDNTQSYVWAAHLLGYQNPDLTLHSAQIRDWFSSEDGMDLRVLDADSSAVRAVADAADDVAARQRDQLAALTAAWQGEGAASAEEFLRRHCDAAEQVAASARTAAQALAGLRDTLWQIVDTKVAAVGAIDDRRRAERPAWLSAAQTVITGAGDRAAASELVDQQVKPFVDNDIRNDWLTAMHTAIASIATSYDAATAEMTPASPVRFELPGDFGPDSAPPAHDEVAPRHDSAPATGAATTSSPPAAAPSYPAAPAMSTPAMSTPAMSTPAVSTPAMSATPAGLPTASATPTPTTLPTSPSSGLDGLGQGFGDALRGLLPSSADGTVPDMPAVDAPTLDDPPTDRPMEDEPDDKADDEADEADETSDESDCDPEGDTGPDDPIPTAVDDAAAAEPPPPAETPPPPEAPVPAPQAAPPESPTDAPVAGSSTPCEIAADELPQAGQ
jgi:uncharacterized protein YukE